MKVKCVREFYEGEKKHPSLEIGQVYNVFHIFINQERDSSVTILAKSDYIEDLGEHSLGFFEIVDSRIPDGWEIGGDVASGNFSISPIEFTDEVWNSFFDDLNPKAVKIFQEVEKKIKLFHDDELELYEKNSVNLANNKFSLSQLSNIIQWSGLKTVEEIVSVILPICDSNQEYLEYKKLFKNLKQSVSDENLKDTMLPNELVSKILDNLGMVVFYRKNSNILSSLSYEQAGSKLRLCHEWSAYIREHGFESVIDYNYEDETIMRTSDALMKYGYEKIERVYERTRVEL
jgi:hypothetical protein